MKFTILLPTAADHWKLVKRAEHLGFSGAWFFDTQMLNADVFVAMAAAAMETSQIRLGTGVLIPSNRIAPVAANAFASLNKLRHEPGHDRKMRDPDAKPGERTTTSSGRSALSARIPRWSWPTPQGRHAGPETKEPRFSRNRWSNIGGTSRRRRSEF